MKTPLLLIIFSFAASLLLAPLPAVAQELEDEIKMGREAVAIVEKEFKVLNDPALTARVDRIGQALAEAANRNEVPITWGMPKQGNFQYTFKVLDTPEINAFALPGGFIYVNKGLLDDVQSDHELAGVLAHEIAHVAHRHITRMSIDIQKQVTKVALPAALAALVLKLPTQDVGTLMQGLGLYQTAITNSYSREAEYDADLSAVMFMQKAGFNPVGMLTFLRRLASNESRTPQMEMGIYQSHPLTVDRINSVRKALESMNIDMDQRAVSKYLALSAKPASADGVEGHEIYIDETQIAFLVSTAESSSAMRAESMMSVIDRHMRDVRFQDVSVVGATVCIRGNAVMTVGVEDARVAQLSREALARRWGDELKKAIWRRRIK